MASLKQLKKIKVESQLPENSTNIVTNVDAVIRRVFVQEKNEEVKLFINLETDRGEHFADVITFKDGNEEATLRYLSMHAGNIFSQFGSDYSTFTESFDEIHSQLLSIKDAAKKFKISTVRSDYNPEYVNVLYGDEEVMQD